MLSHTKLFNNTFTDDINAGFMLIMIVGYTHVLRDYLGNGREKDHYEVCCLTKKSLKRYSAWDCGDKFNLKFFNSAVGENSHD